MRNEDCDDLALRKVYVVLADEQAAREGYIRAIDESGEDYLYPESYFVRVELPREAHEALMAQAPRRSAPLGRDPGWTGSDGD